MPKLSARGWLEKALEEANEWLDDNQEAEKDDFDEKLKEVQDVCSPIISKVYKESGGAPGGGDFGGDDDLGALGQLCDGVAGLVAVAACACAAHCARASLIPIGFGARRTAGRCGVLVVGGNGGISSSRSSTQSRYSWVAPPMMKVRARLRSARGVRSYSAPPPALGRDRPTLLIGFPAATRS